MNGPGDSMFRPPNTDRAGQPFDEATVEAVWNKASISREHSPMRVDPYGALIWKGGYGNTSSKFGWEIGRRKSLAKGGGDDLDNLVPLQWENNRRNGDS
jgi:hypothetical protein